MIIDDPVPTLYTNQVRYIPSVSIQDFIERCLEKDPTFRLSVKEALSHPFLKRASSHHLLQKYLARKPELNKRDYLMSKSQAQKEDYDDDDDDSWDELDLINSTWDFNEEIFSLKPPPVHTKYFDRKVNPSSLPITPADEEDTEKRTFLF